MIERDPTALMRRRHDPDVLEEMEAIDAWKRYRDMQRWRFLDAEMVIRSERLKIKGTPDILAVRDGKRGVIDIKRGARMRWHRVQLAAYRMLLEDAGHRIHWGHIVYVNNVREVPFVDEPTEIEHKQALLIWSAAMIIARWRNGH